MYYHCRPLDYVTYGTVQPHDDPGNCNRPAYEWLGRFCGYCPQIWLSRADIAMTGYRNDHRRWNVPGRLRRREENSVLFGFPTIVGFPVEYQFWCTYAMNTVASAIERLRQAGSFSWTEVDRSLVASLDDDLHTELAECGGVLSPELHCCQIAWQRERPNLDVFLRRHVFVEGGQYVVPSLNLRSAQRILCRNERQKKTLRQMGFIEDRIEIRNTKRL